VASECTFTSVDRPASEKRFEDRRAKGIKKLRLKEILGKEARQQPELKIEYWEAIEHRARIREGKEGRKSKKKTFGAHLRKASMHRHDRERKKKNGP